MEDTDLIERLLTLAGTIMEDGSVTALIHTEALRTSNRLLAVRTAGQDLLALASAIEVVQRRSRAAQL